MSDLLCIDPGVANRGSAYAVFSNGELVRTGFARAPGVIAGLNDVRAVAVERPEYQGAKSDAARVKNLIDLAWVGAALAYCYAGVYGAKVVEVVPSRWKGSLHKPQCHAMIWDALCAREAKVLGGNATYAAIERACEKGASEKWRKPGGDYYPRSFLRHNELDAVGIGLYVLDRLNLTGR